MNQLLKLILTILLGLSLLSMTPFYYKICNYLYFVGFGWLAYDAYQKQNHIDVKVFSFLLILYNPFIPIPLPHFLWVISTIVVMIGLILNILFAEENPYDDGIKKDDL